MPVAIFDHDSGEPQVTHIVVIELMDALQIQVAGEILQAGGFDLVIETPKYTGSLSDSTLATIACPNERLAYDLAGLIRIAVANRSHATTAVLSEEKMQKSYLNAYHQATMLELLATLRGQVIAGDIARALGGLIDLEMQIVRIELEQSDSDS